MLKKIKSSYITKLLFIYINEKRKLKLAKYNKNIQNKINLSIINYKYFTGRYIIYESNGIGKIYYGYDDTLKFEGEYSNSQKNGKGKEYDIEGNLLFEGEYSNGKRNGKGKEYYDNGVLKFEGEYLNGNRHGKGKEYTYDGKLLFAGEYLYDKEWIGSRYYSDGSIIYKLNNNINGKGNEYFWNGVIMFEGEYINGLRKKEKNILLIKI